MIDSLRNLAWRSVALALALTFVCASPLWAEEEEEEDERPRDVNVAVKAEVDLEAAASTGQLLAKLTFTPGEDIDRPYSIRLRLMAFRRTVLNLDHSPKPPTVKWKKGQPVQYDIPIPLPLGIAADADMGIFVGFYDPGLQLDLPPRMEADRQGNVRELVEFPMPDLGPLSDKDRVDALLGVAAKLVQSGQKALAWNALENGLRRSVEDEDKYRFRDAMVGLGAFDPAPISVIEQEIVGARIQAERSRYLRLISGRCFDKKQYHGALRILEAIGGKLSEDARGAVLGALDDAQRTERDISDLRVRILENVSEEDRALADKSIESLGYIRELLEAADWLRKATRWAPARLILRSLALNAPDRDVAHAAGELQKQVEEGWLKDTPPEELQIVEDALNHPVWARTTAIATHKFIYIGPTDLIEGVPEDARRRFDLAYIFLTDLFGRLPNPGGDRVTVYWKELWDFGGGVGGGKKIDIGKADKMRPGMRVDNGLLYHELTHCIDDTNPIFPGWREGLANFGAAYAYEALGQSVDSLHGFKKNLKQFKDDYLDRDIVYWRIPNYGPSAGFFLHFVEAHSKVGRRHDWKPYRKFFREYRAAPMRDGRAPYIGRAVAYYLVRAFGPRAFDDLLSFRFPLVEADREAVNLELEAFAGGSYGVDRLAEKLRGHVGSPLPRDTVQGEMMQLLRSGDRDGTRKVSKEKLGIIHDWKVIGPFKKKGANPGAFVFPPEYEVDYSKEYPGEANVSRWRDPQPQGVVNIDPTGYVRAEFNYMENTATYGLTFLTVPVATDAVVHVRADDNITLFLNDRLVENFRTKSENASTRLAWRGPGAPVPDQLRLPIHLEAGRNKLLVKIRNYQGTAGFILAVARPDGHPLLQLLSDTKAPAPEGSSAKPNPRRKYWKPVLKMNFKSKSFSSKLATGAGKFKVVNAALEGQEKGKAVGWRKYTVRPGFPKDAPSNLIWIKEKYTRDLDEFRLELDFVAKNGGAPKVAVQLQAEGGSDGLSGWNLIMSAHGKNEVAAQIERYEHMYYQVPRTKIPNAEVQKLVLTYKDRRLTVSIGEVVLFDKVSITPIKTGNRIGFSTWPNGLGLRRLVLSKPKKK